MSTIKPLYGSNNQAFTCTITSLVNAAQRQSTVVVNTTNLYVDALVFGKFKTGTSGQSTSGYIKIYAYGSVDGGTTYSDACTGTDAGITLTAPPNLRCIGVVNAVTTGATYYGGPFSVAAAFGGQLPDHWGIVIENDTGATLDASIGSTYYQGIQFQSV
jgi:hypothetical protein